MPADTTSAATLAGSEARVHASVDAVFRLGPGSDPQAYALLFSHGIGNSPAAAAPEPLGFAGAALVVTWIGRARPFHAL
jgi:hypothetical protein